MRCVIVGCVLALGLACAKRRPADEEPRAPAAANSATPAEPGESPVRPTGPPVLYAGEYEEGNPVAADAKYKGKLVTFRNVDVDRIDRTRDGRAYLAPLSVLIQPPARPAGTGLDGPAPRVPEPCYFFFAAAADVAKVKPGDVVEVTGECRGYARDNLWRGRVPGMNWHVDFVNCSIRKP